MEESVPKVRTWYVAEMEGYMDLETGITDLDITPCITLFWELILKNYSRAGKIMVYYGCKK